MDNATITRLVAEGGIIAPNPSRTATSRRFSACRTIAWLINANLPCV
jgi:hypothetical protein